MIGIAYHDVHCNVNLVFDSEREAMDWLLSNAWKYVIIDIYLVSKSYNDKKDPTVKVDMNLLEDCKK